jgi:hypothetical protein
MSTLPTPSEVAIDATSATAFVQQLRDLRIWAGRPSLRKLQLVAGDIRLLTGECISALPRSTVSSVLRGDKLPRSEFVSAFVGACYRYHRRPAAEVEEAVQRWLTVWCRLSAAEEARESRESGSRQTGSRDTGSRDTDSRDTWPTEASSTDTGP